MSVAAASGAVSTQHHQPTQEQIRLAQLIDDKKHDQPEVQEIVRKVLDVVANSNTEDVLLALFDCDYDYERAVALLIEKGHEVASEWRTATNHKLNKKQQQQKLATTKNGYGDVDENGQQQRGNGNSNYRGKSRGSRSIFQQNGVDSQQHNDSSIAQQQRSRGGSQNVRGRHRGQNRAGHRPTDRTYSQQPQDSNVDSSSLSDTTQRPTDVAHLNRRARGGAGAGGTSNNATHSRHQPSETWDVGNWNGETLIYSRTTKDEQQSSTSDQASHVLSEVSNGSLNANNQDKSKSDFDPIEAARQIKNVIGIGQTPKPLMDIQPFLTDPKLKSKSSGQTLPSNNTKMMGSSSSPPTLQPSAGVPPARIPHQPVIFSDRFDGGVNKIDVQFGNLGESYDEHLSATNISIPTSSSAFYHPSEPHASINKHNHSAISTEHSQRTSGQQPSYISPSIRSTEAQQHQHQQQPVINSQRLLPSQMQQSTSMTMKSVVPPPYAVQQQQQQQQQQHQINAPNMVLQSLFYHPPQQQQEPIQLDSAYDPGSFPLSSIDFSTPFYMAAPINQQAQQATQARFVVPQATHSSQQSVSASNRQTSSHSLQNSSIPTTAPSSIPSSSTLPKKGPALPPGIFPPTGQPTQPVYSTAYSTSYGIPPTVGNQQQTGAATYSTPYDTDHLFNNAFIQLANAQQAQSSSGTYGSVTPPVQQQQGNNSTSDNKAMNFQGPFNENLMLLQRFTLQQSNSQQQAQQATGHSTAPLNYFLNRPPSGPSYSPGPQIMYAQPAAAMAQQAHVAKQQGQPYNPNNSSSSLGMNEDYYGRSSSSAPSHKDSSYLYTVTSQNQHIPTQSGIQQANVNKQHQQPTQRTNTNVYNNQPRSYQ